MQQLKLRMYKSGKTDAETTVSIPISALLVAEKLLPVRVRDFLGNEGIEISTLQDLINAKTTRGELIDIENPRNRLVISVE